MPNNKDVSFPDPLLSKKALAFGNYPDESEDNIDITRKIAQHIYQYTDSRIPVYYHLDHSPTSLNNFILLETEKFRLLIEEFEQCINYLNDWVLEHTIMIQFGENDTLVPADSIFDYFLDRVKGDEFSDHRTLIYSEGKRNLEIIAVLVRDDRISLEFRKQEIIKLQSDEGLTLCSGGCLSRLSDTAETLKNYGEFTPISLLKAFIGRVAKDTALRKKSFFRYNFSRRICRLANVLINDYEVHALNYLLERLKSDLNLHFLKLPNDPHITSIKLYSSEHLSDLDVIYADYLHQFQCQINTSHLINFIGYQLYEEVLRRFGEGESYLSLQSFIETKLENLGKDNSFNWEEIFLEDGSLKKVASFRITIAERLIDSEWLDLPRFGPNPSYRLYPANIALSWIKIEDTRQAIIDVIAQQGFDSLSLISHILSKLTNLNLIFHSLYDLYLFFKNLPLSEHERVLNHLAASCFQMHSSVLNNKDNAIDFQTFYQFITALSETSRCIFVPRYNELIRLAICQFLESVNHMDDDRTSAQMTNFISLIIKAGFKDFTGFIFKKSLLDDEDTYLKDINFSCVNLENSVFQTPIIQCHFKNTNLQEVIFRNTLLSNVNFVAANLLATKFEGVCLQKINFSKANLEMASFQTPFPHGTTFLNDLNFERAKLLVCNFQSANIQKISFLKADLTEVNFENAFLSCTDFSEAKLEKVNFSGAELKEVNFKQAKLMDSDFEGTELASICFIRTVFSKANFKIADLDKIDFSYADLRAVNLSQTDRFNEVILTGVTLTIAQLFELYQQGIKDFSKVQLAGQFDKSTQQTLDQAQLSGQAMAYLIKQGFHNFNRENICPNVQAKTTGFANAKAL